MTGYWFLDPAEDWTPDLGPDGFPGSRPAAGLRRLREHEQPQSRSSRQSDPGRAGAGGTSAASSTPVKTAWGKADLPGSMMMVDSVPFSWLFPRVAAVVHHGGTDTTSAGLRAGVPSVVVPFFGDQPFWAHRVADLGVGPAPIPRKKLTAERLAQAIQVAVTERDDAPATRPRWARRFAPRMGSRPPSRY